MIRDIFIEIPDIAVENEENMGECGMIGESQDKYGGDIVIGKGLGINSIEVWLLVLQ